MKRSLSILAVITCVGCTTATYKNPKSGSTLKYRNTVFQKSFESMSVNPETGALDIKGYKSDAAQMIEAATRGAVEGFKTSQGDFK